jgi:AcrR family transcriptional regulator
MQQHTEHGESQKQKLVDAAYDIIATEGFEGLRTRDVAERASLNISTLHYYFPSKEDLVRDVAQRLLQEFRELPGPPRGGSDALGRLHAEFADQRLLLETHPATYRVVMEMFTRSLRDPGMKPIVRELLGLWERHILAYIAAGVEQKQLPAGSDPVLSAKVLHCTLLGLVMNMQMDIHEYPMEDVFQQLENWLKPEH